MAMLGLVVARAGDRAPTVRWELKQRMGQFRNYFSLLILIFVLPSFSLRLILHRNACEFSRIFRELGMCRNARGLFIVCRYLCVFYDLTQLRHNG